MDKLEQDAMMIRAQAAIRFVKNKELPGPIALAMVVAPSQRVLDASLAAARAQTATWGNPEIVTLDELVSTYK